MYGECEGPQDEKVMMVSMREGSWEGRCSTKRRYKEKSTVKEENCNIYSEVDLLSKQKNIAEQGRTFCRVKVESHNMSRKDR